MEKTPSAARHQLGKELSNLFELNNIDANKASEILSITPHTVRRYLRGDSTISLGELTYLLDQLRFKSASGRKILFELRAQADQRLWWSKYKLTEDMVKLLGFENAAIRIQMFELIYIPGPLQSEAYARALIRTDFQACEDLVDTRVRLRMERQKRVYKRKQPPQLIVLLAEHVIHNIVGSVEVTAEALYHMLKGPCSYELRIIPYSALAHIGMEGPFCLFEFDPKVRKNAVYVPGPVRNLYIDLEEDFTEASVKFEYLLGLALSDQESRALVMSVIKELEA